MTDEKIAVGLKKQDTEALVCLMERYSNYISSIIGQLLKNYGTVQDTEELMADVFLTIWNTADKLNMDAYSSLKGYIGTIARNKAKDFLRKKRFVTLALDDDILLFSCAKNNIVIPAKELPTLDRGSKGNKLVDGGKVVGVSKI